MLVRLDLAQVREVEETVREVELAMKTVSVMMDVGRCAKGGTAGEAGKGVEVELALNDIQIVVSKDGTGIARLRLNEPRVKVVYTPPPPL